MKKYVAMQYEFMFVKHSTKSVLQDMMIIAPRVCVFKSHRFEEKKDNCPNVSRLHIFPARDISKVASLRLFYFRLRENQDSAASTSTVTYVPHLDCLFLPSP